MEIQKGTTCKSPYAPKTEEEIAEIREQFRERRKNDSQKKAAARKRALTFQKGKEFARQEREFARSTELTDILKIWHRRLGGSGELAKLVECSPHPGGSELAAELRKHPSISLRKALLTVGVSPFTFLELIRSGGLTIAATRGCPE